MHTLSKELIHRLYHEEKLSTIKIADKLGVTEWVVLNFMRRKSIPRRSFQEANQIVFANKPLSFSLRKHLSEKDQKLKAAGIFLYWGEGAQLQGKNSGVDFANNNPEMIKVFLKFLRRICGINESRLRVFMYCYTDQNIENLLKYWHNITSIPLHQFTKPYVRKDFQQNGRKMQYGLIHIRYADKKLLVQIDSWIKEYTNLFVN